MTKKDYVMIGHIIKEVLESCKNLKLSIEDRENIKYVILNNFTFFLHENKNFDKSKFLNYINTNTRGIK